MGIWGLSGINCSGIERCEFLSLSISLFAVTVTVTVTVTVIVTATVTLNFLPPASVVCYSVGVQVNFF